MILPFNGRLWKKDHSLWKNSSYIWLDALPQGTQETKALIYSQSLKFYFGVCHLELMLRSSKNHWSEFSCWNFQFTISKCTEGDWDAIAPPSTCLWDRKFATDETRPQDSIYPLGWCILEWKMHFNARCQCMDKPYTMRMTMRSVMWLNHLFDDLDHLSVAHIVIGSPLVCKNIHPASWKSSKSFKQQQNLNNLMFCPGGLICILLPEWTDWDLKQRPRCEYKTC